MKRLVTIFRHHKIVSVSFLLAAVFVLGGGAWAYFTLRGMHVPLILHFNDFEGINRIGSVWYLGGVAGSAFVVLVLNLVLVLTLEARDRLWGKVFAVITLLFSVLLFIGFAAIISVN